MTRTHQALVVGAGPTGLGAAHRLRELGVDDFVVLEASNDVGGLARSYQDASGSTYDVGGHVMFTRHDYYARLVDDLLAGQYTTLLRQAWIWIEGRYVPYPFQDNLRHLSPQTLYECVCGLAAARHPNANESPKNFREWVLATFGEGIARHFMLPYNEKVWAVPPQLMSFHWIADRVAVPTLEAVLRHVLLAEDPPAWGPNAAFRYPLRGGIGFLFQQLADRFRDRIQPRHRVVAIDPSRHEVTTADGQIWRYEVLLSTMPIDELVHACVEAPAHVHAAAGQLVAASTDVVGVTVDRPSGESRTWVYYPEPGAPFSRVTLLSNYSPFIAGPDGATVLLTETSSSAFRPVDSTRVVRRVLDGLTWVGMLHQDDLSRVSGVWHHRPDKTYPVPTLGRDAALRAIHPWLRRGDIWSRGRFGAWCYEIGNMDHSVMQGVEWADHVIHGRPETVWQPP